MSQIDEGVYPEGYIVMSEFYDSNYNAELWAEWVTLAYTGECDCEGSVFNDIGECGGDNDYIIGCTNPLATNFLIDAVSDDGSCELPEDCVAVYNGENTFYGGHILAFHEYHQENGYFGNFFGIDADLYHANESKFYDGAPITVENQSGSSFTFQFQYMAQNTPDIYYLYIKTSQHSDCNDFDCISLNEGLGTSAKVGDLWYIDDEIICDCIGEGIIDEGCDCFGNVLDCAGECGGSAEILTYCEDTDGDGFGNPGTEIEECSNLELGSGIDFGDRDTVIEGCNLPDLKLYMNSSGEVTYQSSQPIGGFQFDIEGAILDGASGGDAEESGFLISTGNTTALAFSLIGEVIPAGCGTLINLDLDGEGTGLSNIYVSDPAGNDLFFTYFINESNEAEGCDQPNLTLNVSPEGQVYYQSDEHIGGFQFSVAGATINNASGGSTQSSDFLISTSSSTVLAFSLTGESIPPGCGTLINLSLNGEAAGLYDIIVSDLIGNNIGFTYHYDQEDEQEEENIYVQDCSDIYPDCSTCEFSEININLYPGWNWFSFNILPENNSINSILSSLGEKASFIASQSLGIAENYGVYGWNGTLSTLEPSEMYKIEMLDSALLTISGLPADYNMSISLEGGWNWIGYLPQNSGDVNTALASISESALFIASQSSGVATNYNEYGWAGTLLSMDPGSGYLLEMSSSDELIYPNFDLVREEFISNKDRIELSSTISDWDFNYRDFKYLGTITVSLPNRNDVDGDIVGLFVNNECRGFAERVRFPFESDTYYYIVQVYSNSLVGDQLSFKYYDSIKDTVINYTESIEFNNNMVIGDGFNTYELRKELMIPTEYRMENAYPNPFNPVTKIDFSIPQDNNIKISVYDIQGREVDVLLNSKIKAGYHSINWNGSYYGSGIYFINMNSGVYNKTQKIILVK